MISKVFGNTNIEVTIYNLKPPQAHKAREQRERRLRDLTDSNKETTHESEAPKNTIYSVGTVVLETNTSAVKPSAVREPLSFRLEYRP
jgi:hypothetical protein